MASGNIEFSVRPVFVGWITLLVQLPLQLFFTVWAGGFFGGVLLASGLFDRRSSAPYILIGAATFVAFPLVAYVGKWLNYSRTEYRFFDDHLEFEEGFFSINKKFISFRDVKEVTMRKGILQRIYGLGTIYLATLATGSGPSLRPFAALGFGNVSGSGISVRDIQDSDQTFDRIRQLVDAHRE